MRGAAARWFVGAWVLLGVAVAGFPQGTRPGDYEIGAGDVLKVIVIGQAEMTGSFSVDPEGMVNFPILGKIKASRAHDAGARAEDHDAARGRRSSGGRR